MTIEPIAETAEMDVETSIRMRIRKDVKKRIQDKAAQAGFKSVTEYMLFMALGDAPRRKAPTPERVALIKALANLGVILRELKARPEDTTSIQAQITEMAHTIHNEFGYDSQG